MNLRHVSLLFALLLAALVAPGCGGKKMPMPKELESTPMTSEEARLADAEAKHGTYYSHHLAEFIADNPSEPTGATVLLGDSVVERFPTKLVFPDGSVINRGIGGDRLAGVLDRLDISVEPLAPSCIYILVGINDVLWPKYTDEEVIKQYNELLVKLHEIAPQAKIGVISILPVGAARSVVTPKIHRFNAGIKAAAEAHGAAYIDLYDALADDDGAIYPELTVDGVHLTLEGYEAALQELLPPDQFIDAAVALYSKWKDQYNVSRKADKIDPPLDGEYPGNRGPDQLVVYTPAYGADSTRTNEWGTEAVIVNGVMDRINDGGNSKIPQNGMVVSGHGQAASWILASLKKGMHVALTDGVVHLAPPSGADVPLRDKLNAERRQKLAEIDKLMQSGAPQAKLDAAKKELLAVYTERAALKN